MPQKSVNYLESMTAPQINTLSLGDIDDLVEDFLEQNSSAIIRYWKNSNDYSKLGYDSFITELRPQLRESCITFVNSNADMSVLSAYLFPTVITVSRRTRIADTVKKIAVAVCPAHQFLGEDEPCSGNKIYKCSKCEDGLQSAFCTVQEHKLFSTFQTHNKKGYKCPDCDRFVPHPLDSSRDMICPYYDCYFVGRIAQLTTMRHPTIMQKLSLTSLDAPIENSNQTKKDFLPSQTISSDSELEVKELVAKNIKLIKDTIDSQVNALYYLGSNFTRNHYLCMYEAFKVILDKYPHEMISYLVYLKRGESLQCKIFQEYVNLLQNSMPFGFKKNNKMYRIDSLLDENLCIFDGMSKFEAVVTDKREIKNNTSEFYIGGRSAAYSKPYYIGYLLDVTNVITQQSILSDVREYSFSRIKLTNTAPGTKVIVVHLRVPPHYQMGGMVYLNRIRRKLVDKIYLTLNGTKREVRK